ncbi:MAG TPA: glycosyltransferase family 39 protein [Xanthobacteraceae bacterium]|nr:glycosyltransferase family 39 protein [Xanthobacteraceae bacterium]
MLQSTVKPITLRWGTVDVARWIDTLAIIVLAVVAAIAVATFRDYGLGWDDYTQSQYGQLLVSLYSSAFTDKRALSFVNLYMYGGGFDILATLAAKVLPFGLFETRRLVGAAVGIIGLFVTWRLTRRLGGPRAGLIALILLAVCPLYYGNMFINCKDAPFATAMLIALYGIVRAFEEYPRASPATIALCGIGVGLAIGERVLGGFAVLDAFLPLLLIFAIRARAAGIRPAASECGWFLVPFVPAAILATLVMGLIWPWSVTAPLNLFHALRYFSQDFEKPWRELFDGQLIEIIAMPRSYAPTLLAVQLPELMLALGIGGIVGAIIATVRSSNAIGRRAALLAIVLAATLPVLMTIVIRPYIYNGVRHLLFIVPPLAILGGLAGGWIAPRLAEWSRVAAATAAILFVAGIASPVVDMVRLHPYEYTDFNHIVGGVSGARPLFMLDFWGLSLKQASQHLIAYIASHNEKPGNGKWRVAVCGPHPPVSVALGPDFDISWDPKGADFAMQLGEFYCAKLDAPLLFQIVRDGVVYARVYDLRGRSIQTLLTVPGI